MEVVTVLQEKELRLLSSGLPTDGRAYLTKTGKKVEDQNARKFFNLPKKDLKIIAGFFTVDCLLREGAY